MMQLGIIYSQFPLHLHLLIKSRLFVFQAYIFHQELYLNIYDLITRTDCRLPSMFVSF